MSERDVLLEDVFQGALAVHACFATNTPPLACREQLMEAVDALVAYENGNPSPIRARLAAEQAVIKAAAEWADIYDRWHALTGRDSYAVVSGLRDLLEKKEQQLRGAYTALAAVDGGGQ